MTLCELTHRSNDLGFRLFHLTDGCPYARLAQRRLKAAGEHIIAGRANCAEALLDDAEIHLGYAESAAHIRDLRAAAAAEAARSFYA